MNALADIDAPVLELSGFKESGRGREARKEGNLACTRIRTFTALLAD